MSHYGSERDARQAANVRAEKLAKLRPLIDEADRHAREMRRGWCEVVEVHGQHKIAHSEHVRSTRTRARLRAAKLHRLYRDIATGYPTAAYVLLRSSVVAMKRAKARTRRPAWWSDIHSAAVARKAFGRAAVAALRALLEWAGEP